jgi:hypothetical protein
MNVLEVAVYAMVIGGQPQAIKCAESDLGTVNCTNGLTATEEEPEQGRSGGLIRFSNGVTIDKVSGAFSNGITAHRDGTGWLEFSNGIAVHRDSPYRYRIGNGYVCQLAERSIAECNDSH